MKKYLIVFLVINQPVVLSAQCSGSWSSTNTLSYLCATGPFLQYNFGPVCPVPAQAVFTFSSPVQAFKLAFSALGTSGYQGQSRMSLFLNNDPVPVDLSLACRIVLGCQSFVGGYSISNGCLVDNVSGSDGGISGYIYIKASSFGLPSITSLGVTVSEPVLSGTIFEMDSCYSDVFECLITAMEENEHERFNLYPNPFRNNLNIVAEENEMVQFNLYDIYSDKILVETFSKSLTLPTDYLSKGIYFYEVRDKNGLIKTGKLIKE
jgi:hypothetical protein